MNNTRFTHALNIVLMLDERGCLKQGTDFIDPINDQKLGKRCNKQIQAILIIYEFLLQLCPEKSDEDDSKQGKPLSDRHCAPLMQSYNTEGLEALAIKVTAN